MKRYLISFLVLLLIMVSFACKPVSNDQIIRSGINQFIDGWHLAAAGADTAFFDYLSDDAIYIGTDAKERWTKDEFKSFAMPYFLKGSAWDFKPRERMVYLGDNGKIAWFNETLDTWMGVCRSSGVLELDAEKNWKIKHYHLSCTVPNEKIRDFIDLMNRKESL
jgi:hypothetical protein